MIRLLRLIVGWPAILFGAVMLLMSAAMFAGEEYPTGVIAVAVGLPLLVWGFKLVRGAKKTTSVESLLHPETLEMLEDFQFVSVDGGSISLHAEGEDVRLALKELKLLKKSLTMQKRQIMNEQKSIRAGYTDSVRRRGSKFRGGGGFGRFIRIMQTSSRDSQRAALAGDLAPLEAEKENVQAAIAMVDSMITRVEAKIVAAS